MHVQSDHSINLRTSVSEAAFSAQDRYSGSALRTASACKNAASSASASISTRLSCAGASPHMIAARCCLAAASVAASALLLLLATSADASVPPVRKKAFKMRVPVRATSSCDMTVVPQPGSWMDAGTGLPVSCCSSWICAQRTSSGGRHRMVRNGAVRCCC